MWPDQQAGALSANFEQKRFLSLLLAVKNVTDNHLLIYIEHLKVVKEEMKVRFKDLLDLEVFPWLVKPFAGNIIECDSTTQEMLIDLQSDEEERAMLWLHGCAGFGSSVITDFLNCVRK